MASTTAYFGQTKIVAGNMDVTGAATEDLAVTAALAKPAALDAALPKLTQVREIVNLEFYFSAQFKPDGDAGKFVATRLLTNFERRILTVRNPTLYQAGGENDRTRFSMGSSWNIAHKDAGTATNARPLHSSFYTFVITDNGRGLVLVAKGDAGDAAASAILQHSILQVDLLCGEFDEVATWPAPRI